MKIAAPMQSWGSSSRFEDRGTEAFPTHSGIVGLLASAMGIDRDQPERLAAFDAVEVAVREDKRGRLEKDFHTVDVNSSKGKRVTTRHYLADAAFLVGVYTLADDDSIIDTLSGALASPKNSLFFGRKSFVPSDKISLGVFESDTATDFITSCPIQISSHRDIPSRSRRSKTIPLNAVISDPTGDHILMDRPLSFASQNRQYVPRVVKRLVVDVANPFFAPSDKEDNHDPLSILGDS